MKTITIENPAGLPTIPWAELKDQYEANTLKQAKNRDVGDLKTSILTLGFKVPMFIWVEGKYIVDGAGRFLALSMLEYEGYEIPDLPYLPIIAKNKKAAKQAVLAISSTYGLVTPDSIGEFTLDLTEIDLSFINIEGYNLAEIDWKPARATEVDMDDMEEKGKTKMEHTCPKCQFKFTTT